MDTRVKPFLLATMLPLSVTLVASHFLTMHFLSLELSWWMRLTWLLPEALSRWTLRERDDLIVLVH